MPRIRSTMPRALLLAAFLWGGSISGPITAQDEEGSKVARYSSIASQMSGLPLKHPVTIDRITKSGLEEFLRGELNRELPPEKAAQQVRGLAKFGLLPKQLDLRESLLTLLGESVEAFYDPRTKALKVVKEGLGSTLESEALKALGIDLEGVIVVHEITHAAQDQSFDLSTMPIDEGNNDDLSLALKSVIEGQASAVGWKYGLGDRFEDVIGLIDRSYETAELPGKAGTLPAYLRYSLTFPYGYGTEFVLDYMRRQGGQLSTTGRLFTDLPLSSEQILHPEKFLGAKRDNPILVELPDVGALAGPPWKATFDNVHGEYSIYLILREQRNENLDLVGVRRASEGWGGDRYVVMEDGNGAVAYAWYSTWDTETDAREFFQAYTVALWHKYGLPTGREIRGNKVQIETADGKVQIERRGIDVLVLDGVPETLLAKSDSIWSGTRKREMTSFQRSPSHPAAVPGKEGGRRDRKTYSIPRTRTGLWRGAPASEDLLSLAVPVMPEIQDVLDGANESVERRRLHKVRVDTQTYH